MAAKRSPAPTASPVSLKLGEDERGRLAALATARKRSSHYLMREAVREYLTREEARQSFRDEADEAWRDYEETGLHATQAEMDAWAKSLGTAQAQARAKVAQVVYSRNAIANLDRLERFLAEKNPGAAARAIGTIVGKLASLERFPRLGPSDPERPDVRQLFVPFGATGYVARYRVLEKAIVVLAVRHMREAGYSEEPSEPLPEAPPPRRARLRR